MSWTKNNRVICDECSRFAGWGFDEWTPFGCADPEAPEPYDPSHICKKCSRTVYERKLAYFKAGGRHGDWQKSRAEMRAAKKAGLEWVGGDGLIDTRTYRSVHNEYIVADERHFYEPYLKFLQDPQNRARFDEAKQKRYATFCSFF